MISEKYIKIEKVRKKEGNTLEFKLDYSKGFKKYLSSDYLYVTYSRQIESTDNSILNIPAVSSLITLAWATGANIYVDKLDKAFLECLDRIKPVMAKWHPSFSFSGKIITEDIVLNKFQNKEYGLLYSGGIDSTVSYIRNRNKKPHLISIWGLDVLPDKKALWKKIEAKLNEFAEKENVKIHFIKTNVRQLINESLLSVEFGRSWWVRVSHGLITTGLCAPLTTDHIGTILIASTRGPQYTGEIRYPLGSSPLIDDKISWADVKIIHDSFDLNRQEKIRHILKKSIETDGYPFLRVCTTPINELNCSKCNKCLPSIAGLVMEGIDPNKCGFSINDETFVTLKKRFLDKKYQAFENEQISPEFTYRTDDWKEIQKEIPKQLEKGLYNSQNFFEWLRYFDLSKYGLFMEGKMTKKRILKVVYFRLLGVTLQLFHSLPHMQRESIREVKSKIHSIEKKSAAH